MITKFLTLSLRPIVVVTNSASNILHHLFVIVIVSIGILSYLELIKSNMNRLSRLFLLRSPLHHRSYFATVDCIELIMRVPIVNNFVHLLESFLHPHIVGANNTQRDTHGLLLRCKVQPIVLCPPLPDLLHDIIVCNHMRFVRVVCPTQHRHHPLTLKKVIRDQPPPNQTRPIRTQLHLVSMLRQWPCKVNINLDKIDIFFCV